MFCVGCKSRLPKATAIIGDQFPSAIFLRDKTELELGLKQSTLNLTLCENPKCLLVQLCEPINLDIVYRNYPYQTGTTATMKFILASVVNEVMGNLDPHIEGIILDIGGNDGTLLSLINNDNLIKVNIDAASGINQNKEITNYKYVNSYFSALKYQELVLPAPKVIFCTAVFYQLENPVEFVSEVEKLMDDDSIFCLQLSYLGSMYESNIFDNVVHEHVTYFSLLTLENLLSRVGLKVIGARIVESYGGSLRAYIVKENSKNSFSKFEFELNQIRANEERTRINTPGALVEFGVRFREWQLEMKEMLRGVIHKVGPIYAIGASTKGNMILQFLKFLMVLLVLQVLIDNLQVLWHLVLQQI